MMEKSNEISFKKELIVKKISASKFEDDACETLKRKPETENPKESEQSSALVARQSVIQRAPPAPRDHLTNNVENLPSGKRRRVENLPGDISSGGVILIKDAMMYRIVDILMWKVMGENQLRNFGYPVASTWQILWRVVCHSNRGLGAIEMQPEYWNKDHDCGGNAACFTDHVYQFLEMCAPNLWKRTEWEKLPVEELLRRIYYEGS